MTGVIATREKPEESFNEDWGRELYSSRSLWLIPQHRFLYILLISIIITVGFGIFSFFISKMEVSYAVAGAILIITIMGLPLIIVIHYPPFKI